MDNQRPADQDTDKPSASALPPQGIPSVYSETAKPTTTEKLEEVEKEMNSFERSTLTWARTAVVMSGLAAIFVCLQWLEMHTSSSDTHNLAVASGNQATWTQHLADTSQTQSDRTKELADRMKDQADRTKDLADQAKIQSHEAKISADAARSAADTARDALHVSERAYVVVGKPELDTTQKLFALEFVNSGRIPSRNVEVVAHEATFNMPDIAYKSKWYEAVEKSWQRTKFFSIDPSVPKSLEIPVPQLSAEKLKSGLQIIVVAGFITYNDGFDGTPQQRQPFCLQTMFQTTSKQWFLSPCDPTDFLPNMEAIDGYPNNESKK